MSSLLALGSMGGIDLYLVVELYSKRREKKKSRTTNPVVRYGLEKKTNLE